MQLALRFDAPLPLDLAAGLALKADGQAAALAGAGDWAHEIMAEARAWCARQKALGLRTVTIEEFRAQAMAQPASHKAWGSLPKVLQAAKLLRPALTAAGEPVFKRAAAPKTHGHFVRVWELV